jgi:23S rRNA pseudouridine2605 synthase
MRKREDQKNKGRESDRNFSESSSSRRTTSPSAKGNSSKGEARNFDKKVGGDIKKPIKRDSEGAKSSRDRAYTNKSEEGTSGFKPRSSRFSKDNKPESGARASKFSKDAKTSSDSKSGRFGKGKDNFKSDRSNSRGAGDYKSNTNQRPAGSEKPERPTTFNRKEREDSLEKGEVRRPAVKGGYSKFEKSFDKKEEIKPRRGARTEEADNKKRATPKYLEKLKKYNKDEKERPNYDLKEVFRKKTEPKVKSEGTRLNKHIANAGICSRREADALISEGLIKVNGKIVTEMGHRLQPGDVVTYNGRKLKSEKPVYVLLNKPKDFITTTEDPNNRKTVMELVSNACDERIYPVGRLDRNTTGLLLFTNDGELAEKLTHPSNKVKKIYQVDLDKPITEEDFEKIQAGLTLEDGPVKVDEVAVLSLDRSILGVEIHVGKNRIVRRIFEHLGYDVIRLDRVMYAGLTKKDLSRGHWRYLTEKEVIQLRHFR